MKLTQAAVGSITIPAGKSEHFEWDDDIPGFGVRLRQGKPGRISGSWIYQYRVGSQQRRHSFGSVGAMKAAKARAQAEQFHAKVKLGSDPQAEKAESQNRASETFEKPMRNYLAAQKEDRKPRSYVEIERHMLKRLRPLHRLSLHKIDQRTVAALLADIVTDHGATASNCVRATGSAFFSWMMRAGLIDDNPFGRTGNAKVKGSRERVLDNEELAAIWGALLPEDDFSEIVRLLMLTGQRRDEWSGLRPEEIDFDKGIVVLPPQRTKNGREHTIPLSEPVAGILKGRQLTWPGGSPREFVFGSARHSGFGGHGRAKQALDKRIAGKGAPLKHGRCTI